MSTIPKHKHEKILKDAKHIKSQLDNDILEKTFDNIIYGESIFNYCGLVGDTFTFGQLD